MTTKSTTTRVRAGRIAEGPAYWFHRVLSVDQERVLAERARDGDRAARDELILKNQRLVIRIARRNLGGFLDLDDLVSAGNRGLIRAVEKFEPARGVRFATYATRWIRYTIQCEIRSSGRPIRIANWVVNLSSTYRKQEARMREREGSPPGFVRVCDAMRLSASQRRCLCDALRVAHVAFLSCESEPHPISRDSSPDQPALDDEQRTHIERMIGRLSPRQASVIRLYFGFERDAGLSLAEIGRREGTRWQAIQNARDRALRRLRTMAGSNVVSPG